MSCQLAGNVARDFNNLLTVIFNDLDELREHAAGHPETREFVKRIELAAGRAEQLADRLRAFAGQGDAAPAAVSLGRFLTPVIPVLHRILGRAVRTNIVIADGLWDVWVDSDELETGVDKSRHKCTRRDAGGWRVGHRGIKCRSEIVAGRCIESAGWGPHIMFS